jgi:ABC-type lipoprotein export system ATPase subunit
MTAIVDLHEVFVVHPSPRGGVAALRGLSLDLEAEEICVVLGPSGSGKTTLARLLAGLERPSAGRAVVAEVDLVSASPGRLARHRAESIGYADQHYWRALAEELTAQELVGLPLGLRGVDSVTRHRRAQELLERVGLLDRADAYPGELSGGEQQRIALCAALAHEPRLLIADEPTGELDRVTAREIYDLLATLAREHHTTVVVVSHDPESTAIADRIVHVRDGRVSEEERGEGSTVVVGRGGWLRVPEDILRAAGIGERARVAAVQGVVELRPAGAPPGEVAPRTAATGAQGLLVSAKGLSRRYGNQVALAGLDVSFEPGHVAAVTGPSGSGKSTLLALLAGLDTPDEGSVTIGETVLSKLDREARAAFRRDHVAVVGQAPGLSGFQTAEENVAVSLRLRGVAPAETHERAMEALVLVGLTELAHRRVDALSAGERERVALARAIAARPGVLIADEPTSRLDSMTTLAIGELLCELARTHGTTVICATHDPLLIELASVVYPLAAGLPSGQ